MIAMASSRCLWLYRMTLSSPFQNSERIKRLPGTKGSSVFLQDTETKLAFNLRRPRLSRSSVSTPHSYRCCDHPETYKVSLLAWLCLKRGYDGFLKSLCQVPYGAFIGQNCR